MKDAFTYLRKLEEEGILHVSGDATDDEVLLAAGVDRAKAWLASLTQEAADV